MMKRYFTLSLICLIGLAGCQMGVPGSGVSKTEVREIGDFQELDISGIGTYNIVSGNETRLEITTDDNLLPLMQTEVENGRLIIRPIESVSPKVGIKVSIVTPNLEAVSVSGACTVVFSKLASSKLDLSVSGACTIEGDGELDEFDIDMSGACKMNLKDLRAKNVKVRVSGASSGALFASESVDANMSGAGKMTIYGSPTDVKKSTSGVASIRVADEGSKTSKPETSNEEPEQQPSDDDASQEKADEAGANSSQVAKKRSG